MTAKRCPYLPMPGRPVLRLPGGARLVVFCLVAVEEWELEAPIPRPVLTPPGGGPGPVPDIPNWIWRSSTSGATPTGSSGRARRSWIGTWLALGGEVG